MLTCAVSFVPVELTVVIISFFYIVKNAGSADETDIYID